MWVMLFNSRGSKAEPLSDAELQVKNAWTSIPVDCSEILGDEYDDVLPPD